MFVVVTNHSSRVSGPLFTVTDGAAVLNKRLASGIYGLHGAELMTNNLCFSADTKELTNIAKDTLSLCRAWLPFTAHRMWNASGGDQAHSVGFLRGSGLTSTPPKANDIYSYSKLKVQPIFETSSRFLVPLSFLIFHYTICYFMDHSVYLLWHLLCLWAGPAAC